MEAAATRWIERVVPAIGSLRGYTAADARADLLAGLTVAAVAVPQAMAYAMVAGLPAEYGLYTAIVMTAVGAVLDSSKQLINGPTNAISIAVLSVIASVAPDERVQAAVLLAFMVGAVQLAITLLRLGDLTRYISHSVIVGFTLGAGTLLVLDQVKNLFGMRAAGEHEPLDVEHGIAELHEQGAGGVLVGQPRLHRLVRVGEVHAELLLEQLQERDAIEGVLRDAAAEDDGQVVHRQRERILVEGAVAAQHDHGLPLGQPHDLAHVGRRWLLGDPDRLDLGARDLGEEVLEGPRERDGLEGPPLAQRADIGAASPPPGH